MALINNPLNSYRSVTYNFTMAAVRKTAVNDPASYMNGNLDLVILKSGGKGTAAISSNVTPITRKTGKGDETMEDSSGADLVKGFNQNSPGRFDMFIENVEIGTIMGPNENTGVTLATSIGFDVIEPYSINGFIEALHVSSVAAGYLNYSQASFVLKMEFIGYPDGRDITSAEVVPMSTRYFLFGFSGLEVEVTERGTRYRCKAVPYNEKGLGTPNTLKSPVSMTGDSISDILINLVGNLNKQISTADKESKSEASVAAISDEYDIKFPVRDPNKPGGLDYDSVNEIGKAKLTEIHRDNRLFSFPDPGDSSVASKNAYKTTAGAGRGVVNPPVVSTAGAGRGVVNPVVVSTAGAGRGTTNPTVVKYNPADSSSQIQFRENQKIHEIISSVIRDSTYLKDKLKDIKNSIDEYGMLDYFIIKMEVSNKNEIDTTTRKPFQKFTYVVMPYKIHYTRIPNYAAQQIDTTSFDSIIFKEYNYIYTGKNIDVLGFKLNFNTLYFEALPQAMGSNDIPTSKNSDAEDRKDNVKVAGDSVAAAKKTAIPTPMARTDAAPTSVQQAGGNAGQPQDDPYLSLARNMHNAVIDSQASMVLGELEILGDPFFLVTGGIGNFNPTPDERGITTEGDADHLYGEVWVRINFRNPIDIQPLSAGGTMYFDPNKIPFSGIYRVNKVQTTFSEGMFKQRLTLLRMSGQITDDSVPSDPASKTIEAIVAAEIEAGVKYELPTDEQVKANTAALGNFPG